MHHQLQHAHDRFQLDHVKFEMRDHLMVIVVENEHAKAEITTHGANLFSYQLKDSISKAWQPDLLWLSPSAVWDGSVPLRGGVPICWPWFGAHPMDSSLPAHGLVRNVLWHLDQINDLENGVTEVVLTLTPTDKMRALWPHEFALTLAIEVGPHLAMTLSATNLNDYDLEISEAFHTYYQVSEAEGLPIEGLEGCDYADKLQNFAYDKQKEPLVIEPPIDRVYLDHTSDAIIKDAAWRRAILVEKVNSASTVVWNPGAEFAEGFADMPNDAWHHFVCVETANALDNRYMLPSGATHHLQMVVKSSLL
jgi:glucose-6-phosphate 1-epimerase